MHPKVLGKEAWTLVRALVSGKLLAGWTLAGGTGLALQFGHRLSEDLDFFRVESFEPRALIDALSRHGSVAVQSRSEGTLHATVRGVRVSFLRLESPLLFPGSAYRGLMVADPRDIAVMKLVAIGGRGSRKDFVDFYYLIQNGISLDRMFECLQRRFASVDFNEYHLMKSLVFFDDAESEPMPRMLRRTSWEEMRQAIRVEVQKLS
ncbi:MAG: nucleotidyl transferase AbiEii/AbiGii toxin family protein [Acidobacteriota bacterium]|nr:nucleotidyl transferase AbiEii/AbiGii toxin family protein [Acidobacteriota bacterium]